MKTIEGKVVVLGSQGVGKTSLITQYIGRSFSPNIAPTIGASFFTTKLNVDSTSVKLQVWDTAGQERFKAMVRMYYRNANAAIFVFDLSEYYTFRCIKTWVQELQANVDEPVVLTIVGNKSDLEKRSVSDEEVLAYADSIGAAYFETSAKQGWGVDDVFFYTARQLITLSNDPQVTSLRVFDSAGTEPFNGPFNPTVHAEQADPVPTAAPARCC